MRKNLSIEERLLFNETLLDAILSGQLLEEPKQRALIANQLYTMLDAAQRHGTLPERVHTALYQTADAQAGIDSCPDALTPTLRSALP